MSTEGNEYLLPQPRADCVLYVYDNTHIHTHKHITPNVARTRNLCHGVQVTEVPINNTLSTLRTRSVHREHVLLELAEGNGGVVAAEAQVLRNRHLYIYMYTHTHTHTDRQTQTLTLTQTQTQTQTHTHNTHTHTIHTHTLRKSFKRTLMFLFPALFTV